MPDFREVIRNVTAPARHVDGFVRRSVASLRQQAPGARMIGEFAVKLGLKEVDKRLRGHQPQAPVARADDDGDETVQ